MSVMDQVAALDRPNLELSQEEAVKVAAETDRQLGEKGWCLWKCAVLDGDVIVVVLDEMITDFPSGYPIYTLQELHIQANMPAATKRLAHLAKKTAGTKIIFQEKERT